MFTSKSIKWRKGYPYVYTNYREGKKTRSRYEGPYWEYFQRTGMSWRDFLSDRARANIFFDADKRDMLDTIEYNVLHPKRGRNPYGVYKWTGKFGRYD